MPTVPKDFKPIQRIKLPDAKPMRKRDQDVLDPAKAVARGNRMQREEAGESKVMKNAKGGKAKCYAKGGSVSSRADGVAKKGRTSCKMPKMAKGGKAKGCK